MRQLSKPRSRSIDPRAAKIFETLGLTKQDKPVYDMPRVGLVHHKVNPHTLPKLTRPLLRKGRRAVVFVRGRKLAQRVSRKKGYRLGLKDLWPKISRAARWALAPAARVSRTSQPASLKSVRWARPKSRAVEFKHSLFKAFGIGQATRRTKRWEALLFRAPSLAVFARYQSYLSRFVSKPTRQAYTKAKNFTYWRSGWFTRPALDPALGVVSLLAADQPSWVLRGMAASPKFRLSATWVKSWWWSKLRTLIVRPGRTTLMLSDGASRPRYFPTTAGSLLEFVYKRGLVIRALNNRAPSAAAGPAAGLLNIIKRKADKTLQPVGFSHRLSSVKEKSRRLLRAVNFAHKSLWITPFINAFVRAGRRRSIEASIEHAMTFLRVYLGWVLDFFSQAAIIIDKGRPIFRFVVFERKMKKRKKKSWTVPKLLFKERGYVWGARQLWLRVSPSESLKLVDRFVLMLEELSQDEVLKEFVSGRYTQVRRANRLRRWMRFLRKKYKRTKLRSILTVKLWWRYAWFGRANFRAIQGTAA